MEDWYGHKKPEVLTHKLACKHIFGDEKVHTIVSYWKFDTDYREAELIRLTIDDVESPIYVHNRQSISQTITMNRYILFS